MRNLNRLLQKGNLTPRERHFLKVANLVNKEKAGKAILSEADEYALIEGWQPTTNDEVKEYNRYNQAWKTAMFAELDAQTTYLHAKLKYQSMQGLLNNFFQNPFYSEAKRALDELGLIKRVTAKKAIEIINRQREEKLKGGQTIDGTIYQLAFELIDEKTKKKLLALFGDAETERDYLDEEQELAELYKKKDFETIAERVSKKCYNSYAKEYQLYHYYACIPLEAIAKRYAKENSLTFEKPADEDSILNKAEQYKKKLKEKHPDEYKRYADKEDEKKKEPQPENDSELEAIETLAKTLEKHAKEKKTTVEAIIKETCLKWINEGMLGTDYDPLILADPELLNKWIETKEKARQTLQGLIDKGTLKTGKAERDGAEIITGESLYNSGLDYAFVKEFKDYVDEYSPKMGLVKNEKGEVIDDEFLIADEGLLSWHMFLLKKAKANLDLLSIVREKDENGEAIVEIESEKLKKLLTRLRDGFISDYEKLIPFEELFNRLSKTYDMDLSYRVRAWTAELKDLVESFNDTLLDALKTGLPFSTKKKKRYKDKELFIDTEKIKPNRERVEPAFEEIGKLLGDAF